MKKRFLNADTELNNIQYKRFLLIYTTGINVFSFSYASEWNDTTHYSHDFILNSVITKFYYI